MDTKRLIAEIQRETHIRLDEADPVLAAAVINERLLDATMVELRGALTRCLDQMAAQTIQNEESAKKVSARIIEDAAIWVAQRFKDAADLSAAKVVADIRTEMHVVERTARTATRSAYLSIAGGIVSLAVAVGLVAGVL